MSTRWAWAPLAGRRHHRRARRGAADRLDPQGVRPGGVHSPADGRFNDARFNDAEGAGCPGELHFNVGVEALKDSTREAAEAVIRQELPRWCFGDACEQLAGLVRRRAAEVALFTAG